jgi:flagellar protein FliS
MTNATRAYARTRNETASKERLMVMLFEAALRHMRLAATALDGRQVAQASPSLARASEIVAELLATLDAEKAPDLHKTLAPLYLFVSDRLLKATLSRDANAVREAERVFAPIADGFAEAVKMVERGEGGPK